MIPTLESLVRKAHGARPIMCATCSKSVDRVRVAKDPNYDGYNLTGYCHKATETVVLEGPVRFGGYDEFWQSFPRTMFLRNWAGYTNRPLPRRGRRM